LTVEFGLRRDFADAKTGRVGLISAELELFADYYQISLFDDGSVADLGP
jgi:hypothetical protein